MGTTIDEEEFNPAAVLTSMFEQLPEDLQEAVFEMVADLYHLAFLEKRIENPAKKGSESDPPPSKS